MDSNHHHRVQSPASCPLDDRAMTRVRVAYSRGVCQVLFVGVSTAAHELAILGTSVVFLTDHSMGFQVDWLGLLSLGQETFKGRVVDVGGGPGVLIHLG